MKIKTIFKNVINVTLISLLACGFSFILSACNEHKHKFSDWDVTSKASCLEAGSRTRHCLDCGEVETETLPALGHDLKVDSITQAPTCELPGKEITHCTRCGIHGNVVEIDALGHEWGEVISDDYSEHYHVCQRKLTDTEGNEIGTCGEKSGKTIISSTELDCETDRSITEQCDACEQTFYMVLEQHQGHNYDNCELVRKPNNKHTKICTKCFEESEEVDCDFTIEGEKVEVSCTTDGYTIFECACGNTMNKNIVEHQGHDYTEQEYQHTITNGVHYHYKSCTKCGYEDRTECNIQTVTTLPDCNHNSEETPIDKDHPNILLGMGYDTHTCEECGYSFIDNVKEKLNHVWGNYIAQSEENDGTKYYHIRKCQNEVATHEDEKTPCVFSDKAHHDATCEEDEYTEKLCPICNNEYNEKGREKLGHSYTIFEDISDDEQHKVICANDPTHIQMVAHDYGDPTATTEANCTEAGYKRFQCPQCNHSYSEKYQETLGHKWINAETNEGWKDKDLDYHYRKCSVCSTEETLNHNFENSNICVCGHDDTKYTLVEDSLGKYYVVSGLSDRARNARNIIIKATHQEANDDAALPIKKIDKDAFFRVFSDQAFIETVTVEGTNLNEIGSSAFYNQAKLTSFVFDDVENAKLETLDYAAFYLCKSLSNLVLPKTVTYIAKNSISDTALVYNWENGDEDALYLKLNGDETYFLIKVRSTVSEFEVDEKTLGIYPEAFKDCTNLTQLTLHNKLKYIDSNAFMNCTGLYEGKVIYNGGIKEWLDVDIENELASPLHYTTEFHITNLTEEDQNLDLSDHTEITQIHAGVFNEDFDGDHQFKLLSIKLPNTIQYIGEKAFYHCSSLAEITIAEGSNVKFIGADAFVGTAWYESNRGQDGALYLGEKEYLIDVLNDKINGTFVLENSVKVIADNAFKDCTNLTAITINAESSLVTIGDYAFYGCTGLQSIYIPINVKLIGEYAFVNSGLTSAEFAYKGSWFATFIPTTGPSIQRAPDTSDTAANANHLKYGYVGWWTHS